MISYKEIEDQLTYVAGLIKKRTQILAFKEMFKRLKTTSIGVRFIKYEDSCEFFVDYWYDDQSQKRSGSELGYDDTDLIQQVFEDDFLRDWLVYLELTPDMFELGYITKSEIHDNLVNLYLKLSKYLEKEV